MKLAGGGVMMVAVVGAAWLGYLAGVRHQEPELAGVLQRQGQELKRMSDELAAIASKPAYGRPCPNGSEGPVRAGDLPVIVEDSVRRVMAEQAEHDEAEAEAAARPSAESHEAFVEGEAVVAQALQNKTWTDADVAALRQLASKMHVEHAAALERTVAAAINERRVELAVSGPTF